MQTCDRCGFDRNLAKALFCAHCGKVLDRPALKRTAAKVQSFTGAASLSPRIERFWETGDAAVVYHDTPLD